MAKKMDLEAFVARINREVLGLNDIDISTTEITDLSEPKITENTKYNKCSCKRLLKGGLFIWVSSYGEKGTILQKKVKEEIKNYVKRNRLTFIITTPKFPEVKDARYVEPIETHGAQYIDPFKTFPNTPDYGYVFVNKFPYNICGATVHFLGKRNFKVYKEIINNLN